MSKATLHSCVMCQAHEVRYFTKLQGQGDEFIRPGLGSLRKRARTTVLYLRVRPRLDPGPSRTARTMRAALVRSWAIGIAVCVCVNCLIYLYSISQSITVLSSGSIPAHASAACCHRSMIILDRTLVGDRSRASRNSYVQMGCTQSVVPIPSVYLCLSSKAELTPASVNPGMPSARTHYFTGAPVGQAHCPGPPR